MRESRVLFWCRSVRGGRWLAGDLLAGEERRGSYGEGSIRGMSSGLRGARERGEKVRRPMVKGGDEDFFRWVDGGEKRKRGDGCSAVVREMKNENQN
ncbi:hypothetical protein HAX54_032789 [Datura stramonium]|uniref:Uncharacterized protein n=1 Tax=Datura stramonium TaxID=4076 RepID=A0ABS8VEA5_DATST|nr:hypothetical protein [Datura stramonium]